MASAAREDGKDADGPKGSAHSMTESVRDGALVEFGYASSYRRIFRTLSSVCVAVSAASPLAAILISGFYQVTYGGYYGLTWGWIVPSLLWLPQALVIAELCSSMPVNGGFYWWAAALAPPRAAKGAAFIAGWLNVCSLMTSLTSYAYAAATSLSFSISVAQPSFTPTNAQIMGIAMGIVIFWAAIMTLRLEDIGILCFVVAAINFALLMALVIGLPASHAVSGKPFASASTVFTTFNTYSDWQPGVSALYCWLGAAWANTGWSVPVYMAEEAQDSARSAPKAIISTYLISFFIGTVICLLYAFVTVDMEALAADPAGYPLFQSIIEHWGSLGASVYFLITTGLVTLGGSALLLVYSNQLAAFSRDGGLPFSSLFARVHARTNIPIYATALMVVTVLLLLLLSLADFARNIIYSLAVFANVLCWSTPVALRIFAGERWIPGPINYGRWSLPLHVFAFATQLFLMVLECFPPMAAFTAASFQYHWVLSLSVVFIASLYYKLFPHNFKGLDQDFLQAWRADHGANTTLQFSHVVARNAEQGATDRELH